LPRLLVAGTTKARKHEETHEEEDSFFFVFFRGLRVFVVAFVLSGTNAVCGCIDKLSISEQIAIGRRLARAGGIFRRNILRIIHLPTIAAPPPRVAAALPFLMTWSLLQRWRHS